MWDVPQLERTDSIPTSVSGTMISTVAVCSRSSRPNKKPSINLPIQDVGKAKRTRNSHEWKGRLSIIVYVVMDAIPYKHKLGIVYRLLVRVVMCFCNDEGLLVGPRTVFSR